MPWRGSLGPVSILGILNKDKGRFKTGGVKGRLEHALRLGLNPVFTSYAPWGSHALLWVAEFCL